MAQKMTAFELIVIAIRIMRVKKPNWEYLGQKEFCKILPLEVPCYHQHVLQQHHTQHSICSAVWSLQKANACACLWSGQWLAMLLTTRLSNKGCVQVWDYG